jgi:Ras-related protein Rab-11A
MYCRKAVGALLVYDVTSSNSFASIGRLLEGIREQANPQVAIILIGNKTDCDALRKVNVEEGKGFAEREHLLFLETSAVDATNVTEAFKLVTAEVIARYERGALD